MTTAPGFPRFRAVGVEGVLVEFSDTVSLAANDKVRRLDAALAAQPYDGFTESVPAYTSLFVGFDPLRTCHEAVEHALSALLSKAVTLGEDAAVHDVLVCYDEDLAPDLPEVATRTGLSREDVVAAHLDGDYRVFMYGFAPGYAYLGGVPETLQLPRKEGAVRGVPAGSVLIAGPQCLVSTLTMPTGWWIIGRSPTPILREHDPERPFLFDVGDTVKFRRVDRHEFDRRGSRT